MNQNFRRGYLRRASRRSGPVCTRRVILDLALDMRVIGKTLTDE